VSIACPSAQLDGVALFRHFPALRTRVPWVVLGDWPTAVEPLRGHRDVYIKREDRSSERYGGNKVRTLEAHMGRAIALGARRIWATGAFGSNHSVATVLHAARAGLEHGIALFPQPPSRPARDNLLATLSAGPAIAPVPNVVLLPAAMARLEAESRRHGAMHYVMSPGGATPFGALGHVSAALELADQVAAGEMPAPARIVLAIGSTCTTVGLLVGLHIAHRLDLLPRIHITAVRVTPWPITSRPLILHLAQRTAGLLSHWLGPLAAISGAELASTLSVETRYFGGGYGHPTSSGRRATEEMARAGGPPLDVVYSAKSAAALFELERAGRDRPLLFWATKSSLPLPVATAEQLARATPQMQRWLERAPL
jgi:D-cysteine desulfhydrase